LLYSEKRPANYAGLVNDHNPSWCSEFKKSKNQYRDMLQKAIEELEAEFKKLVAPSVHDVPSKSLQKRQKRKRETGDMLKKLEEEVQEEIDV
jgi:ubiquitin-activating enzyme E1